MKAAGGGAASSFLDCTNASGGASKFSSLIGCGHKYATDAVPADNQEIPAHGKMAKSYV
jgi:hypothetical protein